MDAISRYISFYQSRLEKLQNMKKSCLQKMFPRENQETPAVRFTGFTQKWEKRTLGSCFDARMFFAL